MKKTLLSLRHLVLFTALLLPFSLLLAQQPQSQDKVQIKIEKKENGESVLIEETIPAKSGGTSIDAILQQYGIDTEFGDLQDNEEVEIIIRRKAKDVTSQDVHVTLDIQKPKSVEEEQTGKPFLGVYFENGISQEKALALGIKDLSVAYVTSVIENTGASDAKLQMGDVITAVNGVEIRPGVGLRDLIHTYQPGDKVTLSYIREGKEKKVKAKLGQKPVENHFFPANQNESGLWSQFEEEDAPQPVQKPRLGISGDPRVNAVMVAEVFPHSTASKIGLQENDLIQTYNGTPIHNWNDLIQAVQSTECGAVVEVKVIRDGNLETLSGTLSCYAKGNSPERPVPFVEAILYPEMEIHVVIRMENVSPEEVAELNKGQEGGGISAENNLQVADLKFYPNPNDGRFSLEFNLPEKGTTQIRIFDMSGVTIYQAELSEFSGRHQSNIDISSFSKGIYFLQIEQNGRSINKKVVTQ
ncbi:MAG: PDZ domain-containing protein [Bacteroidia bacterium]|nr:PDZ domain-containing protein [Bacteroidia bacterium]